MNIHFHQWKLNGPITGIPHWYNNDFIGYIGDVEHVYNICIKCGIRKLWLPEFPY